MRALKNVKTTSSLCQSVSFIDTPVRRTENLFLLQSLWLKTARCQLASLHDELTQECKQTRVASTTSKPDEADTLKNWVHKPKYKCDLMKQLMTGVTLDVLK